MRDMMFQQTLNLNANHPVKCTYCKKEERLEVCHLQGWAYRDKIQGFICPECYKGYEKGDTE